MSPPTGDAPRLFSAEARAGGAGPTHIFPAQVRAALRAVDIAYGVEPRDEHLVLRRPQVNVDAVRGEARGAG